MEKRKLDLNAPILSARRYSSPSRSTELAVRKATEKSIPIRQHSLPVNNNSRWENEEVTKPAAVPFHWEQIPGRPKDKLDSQAPTPDANTPRLPPARVSDAIRRNSGESPRLPSGRVSGPSGYDSGERCTDQNIYSSQTNESFACSDHAMLLEKLNDSLKCKEDSDGSESGDDAYSDARDTLSATESRSINYSVSGLSGNHSSGVMPSGTFCIDKQTRDLMMNRFLPAAKAAVIEAPQYAAKKSPVVNEQPKPPVRRVVSGEITKPTPREHHSNVLPHNSQYVDYTESDDDEQECKAPVKKSWKVWGILPRFCVKNSLCLLNPLPAMKSRTRPATPPTPPTPSPAGVVRRLSRKALSGPLDKSAYHVPDKKRFHSGLLSRDLLGVEGKLDYDSNQFLDSRDSVKLSMSPLRRYRSGNISPYRNEAPKSPFREGVGFLGMPKEPDNQIAYKIASSRKMLKALQDVSRSQVNENRSSSVNGDDPVEKTLYVDFVNKVETPTSRPSVDRIRASPGNRRVQDYNAAAKSFKERNISEGQTKHSPPKDAATYKALPWGDGDVEDVKSDRSLSQESAALECVSVAKLGVKEERKSHLPPPLPKSPSESWLWRTLPSINPFSHSNQRSHSQSKKLMQKSLIADTKWETIVKTSNPLHDHIRYSEMQFHRQSKS